MTITYLLHVTCQLVVKLLLNKLLSFSIDMFQNQMNQLKPQKKEPNNKQLSTKKQ